jgi:hypothetical protein
LPVVPGIFQDPLFNCFLHRDTVRGLEQFKFYGVLPKGGPRRNCVKLVSLNSGGREEAMLEGIADWTGVYGYHHCDWDMATTEEKAAAVEKEKQILLAAAAEAARRLL